jgi:hypothetical protein
MSARRPAGCWTSAESRSPGCVARRPGPLADSVQPSAGSDGARVNRGLPAPLTLPPPGERLVCILAQRQSPGGAGALLRGYQPPLLGAVRSASLEGHFALPSPNAEAEGSGLARPRSVRAERPCVCQLCAKKEPPPAPWGWLLPGRGTTEPGQPGLGAVGAEKALAPACAFCQTSGVGRNHLLTLSQKNGPPIAGWPVLASSLQTVPLRANPVKFGTSEWGSYRYIRRCLRPASVFAYIRFLFILQQISIGADSRRGKNSAPDQPHRSAVA